MRYSLGSLSTLGLATAVAVAAIFILAGEPARAAGVTYYVSTSGNDSAAGTQSQPFRTVQAAAGRAGPGDTVNIAPGVYAPFSAETSGTATAPVTFRGSAGVWIDGNCGNHAIEITGDYVTVQDLGARRANTEVIHIFAAGNVTLDRLTVTDWNCGEGEDQYRAGISSWGGGRALTVRDSYLERRVSEAGDDVGHGNGIWVKNTGPGAGGGHIFSGNTIIGGHDGIGGEPEDYTWGVFNGDTLIENNTVRECDDDGIQVEGGTHNITVSGNTISGCLIGVAFAPALGGPLTIVGNVITDPQPWRGEGPAAFKAGDDSTGEVRIYHNSFFAGATPADGFKQTNPNLANIHLLNNAIYAGRYTWETYSHTGSVTADYDALYTTDSGRFVKWENNWHSSLASLRSGTGQETNGLTASSFGWDSGLHPLAGSPLIDAGVVIPGVNDGYSGSAPDIGAFEFGGASPPSSTPPPTAAPTPAPTATPAHTSAPTQAASGTPGPTSTPAASATPTATPPAPSRPPQLPPQAPTTTPTPTATATPAPAFTPTPTATPGPADAVNPRHSAAATRLLPGDVNCDGAITPIDALLLLQAAAGLPPAGCAHLVDIDCDGALTAADARAILTHLVEIVPLLADTCPQSSTA